MNKEDLIVGREYTRPEGGKFLACGVRRMFVLKPQITGAFKRIGNDTFAVGMEMRPDLTNQCEMEEKFLICLDGQYRGLKVKEGEDAIPGYWDGFQLVGP